MLEDVPELYEELDYSVLLGGGKKFQLVETMNTGPHPVLIYS